MRARVAARQWSKASPARDGSGKLAYDTANVAPSASHPSIDNASGAPASSTVRVALSGLHGRAICNAASGTATLRQFKAGLHAASPHTDPNTSMLGPTAVHGLFIQ
jgi:hypothetical protein